MGKRPDEIRREIAAHRSMMQSKIERLEGRVRDDVRDASEDMRHDVLERTRINEYVEKRPLTTVAGALGAGILLGVLSESVSFGGQDSARRSVSGRYREDSGAGVSGMLDDLLRTAAGFVGGGVQHEVRELLRQVLGDESNGDARRASDGNGDGAYQWLDRDDEYRPETRPRSPHIGGTAGGR